VTERIPVALVGASGRMGREIARAAADRPDVTIVAAVDRPGCPELGRDLGEVAGVGRTGVPIGIELRSAAAAARVIVDLSLPEATPGVVRAAVEAGIPLVCGTTGLDASAIGLIERAAATIPVLQTTNLSAGVAVLTRLVAAAARALGPGYDVEIVEAHHRGKVDAPSGTAMTLAGAAAGALGIDATQALVHGRRPAAGPRRPGEIGMHAIRGGGVVGDHTVIFAGPHERVELVHRAGSRAVFAEGALRAAVYLATAKPGLHTMAEVLGLDDA